MIHKTIGDRLKISLKLRGISQAEFAKRLNITQTTMNRYIKGSRQPKADTIVEICTELGISSDWLLGLLE